MPLKKGKGSKKARQKVASSNIKELHAGKQYKATSQKWGKSVANRQAVAIGLKTAGLSRKKKKGSK